MARFQYKGYCQIMYLYKEKGNNEEYYGLYILNIE